MLRIRISNRPLRVLDFDIEMRPLSWISQDYVSAEVTAIACQFVGEKKAHCWLLGQHEPEEILEGFVAKYNQADMVTGHYIRNFDLPRINAGLAECGLPLLQSKLTQDTKNDLVKWSGLSKSQESIGAMLGLKHPKIDMNQAKWREANRLTPAGIAHTRKRVIGDVRQHIEMRAELLNRGLLKPPRMWTSASVPTGSYAP